MLSKFSGHDRYLVLFVLFWVTGRGDGLGISSSKRF